MSSIVSQILNNQQRVQFIQSGTGTVILLDCCVQETHSRESPPTEFEVEDGQTISDHIIVKPFSLEIQGIISDTPISALTGAMTTLTSVALPPVGVVGAAAGSALYSAIADTASPSQVAYKQLRQLQESRLPFNVLTSLNRYENMWIKSLSIPRDANTGQILMFTVSLVQILLASPQTVNLQLFRDADMAASFANLGKQEMVDPGIAQATKAGVKAGSGALGVAQ